MIGLAWVRLPIPRGIWSPRGNEKGTHMNRQRPCAGLAGQCHKPAEHKVRWRELEGTWKRRSRRRAKLCDDCLATLHTLTVTVSQIESTSLRREPDQEYTPDNCCEHAPGAHEHDDEDEVDDDDADRVWEQMQDEGRYPSWI